MKDNQFVNGKIDAVQDFRDVLAEEIRKEFPDLDEYVDQVIENTGGVREPRTRVKTEPRETIQVD